MIELDAVLALGALAAVVAGLYNVVRWAWFRPAQPVSPAEDAAAEAAAPDAVAVARGTTSGVAPTPRTVAETWAQTQALANDVRDEYAAYLFDPLEAFRYPLLNDVSAGTTQHFLGALAAYTAAEPELPPTDPALAGRLLDLARELRESWVTAYDRAHIVGLEYLSAPNQDRVRRAIKALQLALDPAATDAERRNACAYALRLVHGVLDVHRQTRAALDAPSPPAIDGA